MIACGLFKSVSAIKVVLFKTIFHIVIVLCILTAQVGSAFAMPSQMHCAQMPNENSSQMFLSQEDMAAHSAMMQSMLLHDITSNSTFGDCCEHDCGCSQGLLILTATVNKCSNNQLVRSSLRISSRTFGDIHLVLPQPQRPPKQ